MRSSYHMGVSHLRPIIPNTHPVIRLPSGSGSYCMTISPLVFLSLASCESASVSQSCFSVASWRHHASLLPPPPLYSVSLAHTSNKYFILIKMFFFYHFYEFNHWQMSGTRVLFFKYNHFQPPDADDFRHVDVILS